MSKDFTYDESEQSSEKILFCLVNIFRTIWSPHVLRLGVIWSLSI